MMKILLLGSGGFIGKNIREYYQYLDDKLLIASPSSRELNLLDEKAVSDFLKQNRFDVVINCAVANRKRESFSCDTSELYQDLRMFMNLEKCSDMYGKMIYLGSGAEFDKRDDIANASEFDFNGIPITEYGLAKYTIGKLIEASKNIYNLRVFGLFGKYENWKTTFISGACCKAIKGLPITIRQNCFFDYLYIDDFCKIIDWFIWHVPKHQTYNVSSGEKIDLLSIAEIVNELVQRPVPIYVCKEGMAKEYTASNERLKKEIGDLEITGIKDAIRDLLRFYQGIEAEIDIYSLLYQ